MNGDRIVIESWPIDGGQWVAISEGSYVVANISTARIRALMRSLTPEQRADVVAAIVRALA
jgi:hypothetical protein